jgi:two-component system, NtrC family, sensor kinase
MSLQSKIISLIFLVFLAYGALVYGVQRGFILPSFLELEREEAVKNMDRAVQAIEREVQHLAISATDWGMWDDTYQFVQDFNDAYREANLNIQALEGLRVNLFYLFNQARQPAWGTIYDLEEEEEIALPGLVERLAASPLTALTEPNAEVEGLLITTRGPLLIAARPVLTSNREGPVQGTMLLGRFLDAAAIAEQTRIQLYATVLGDAPLAPEEAAIVAELGDRGETLIRAGTEVDRVYRIQFDLFGQPALLLRVEVPKAISARGHAAIRFALLSLLGVGLAILAVLVIGLRQMVLKPLQQLTGHAVAIGQSGNLSERLTLERQDELGVLAREFDQMVERLAEARKALVDRSYQSGVAEMASGVLHNIGNAITPLKVRVANLESALREAPAAELRMALTELADPATPADRRGDLEQFANLAGQEIATALETTTGQMAGVARQVEHVQRILSDQERFSRAARVLEPVSVVELVRESVDLLGDDGRRELQVELDPSLTAAGSVLGSRVALQQILVNLLKNAVEAVREQAPPPGAGHVVVGATPEFSEGRAMVRLCVTDNGIGISPEHLSRVFERGFSTKSRASSGLGLHWCAVTAAALGGGIQAESAGTGQGTRLILRLPQAESHLESPPVTATEY